MQNILKYMLFMPHVHLPYMETIPNKERQLLDDSISSLSTNRGAGGGGSSCSVHRVTQPGTKRNQTPSVLEKKISKEISRPFFKTFESIQNVHFWRIVLCFRQVLCCQKQTAFVREIGKTLKTGFHENRSAQGNLHPPVLLQEIFSPDFIVICLAFLDCLNWVM